MSGGPFVVSARGRTEDQASFVTDGSLILREDALRSLAGLHAFAPEVRELTSAQIGGVLSRRAEAVTDLDAVVPSRLYPNTFRTGDDVALGARYIALLRHLPGPIRLGTTGPRGPVMLFDLQGLLGALMPVATVPENAERLPAPSPGARRGRIVSLTPDGSGRLAFADGSASFTASALHGVASRDLVVDGLLDCDLDRGLAVAAWPAGMGRPETVAPRPALRWPRSVVLRSLQAAGLLGEYDGGSFSRLVQRALPSSDLAAMLRDEPLGEPEILQLLLAHYGSAVGTPAAARDGLVLPWLAQDDADAPAGLARVMARLGLPAPRALVVSDLAVAADRLDEALRAAGRSERVWLVSRTASYLLVRDAPPEIGPLIGAIPWRARTAAR
jgi:hypothetical protein